MKLTNLSEEQLLQKRVLPKFARILAQPSTYHEDLCILIGCINWNYFIPEQAVEVVPMWGSNADASVRWVRSGRTEYVAIQHDDPVWYTFALSEQGAMCRLWQDWIEFQDADNAEAKRFAEEIGFVHWNEALKLLEDNYEAFENWMLELESPHG